MAEIARQVHQQVAQDLNAFDEDTGQIVPNAQAAEPEAQDEPQDPPAVTAPPVEEPAKPRMATIVVDGQPIEVEEARLLEAGKRTLQKESAADKRLQEAERKRQEAERLLQQAQRLSQPDGQQTTAPSQDAPPAQQATNGFPPEMLDTFLDQKLYVRDAQKAREAFDKEFPEIAADPDLMEIAARREQTRLGVAARLGEGFGDPFEAYRKHGEYIREKFKTAPAPVQTAALQDKAERKRSITVAPAVNARPPAPKQDKPLSGPELIEAMRQARKAGRQLPTHRKEP